MRRGCPCLAGPPMSEIYVPNLIRHILKRLISQYRRQRTRHDYVNGFILRGPWVTRANPAFDTRLMIARTVDDLLKQKYWIEFIGNQVLNHKFKNGLFLKVHYARLEFDKERM